MIYPGFSHPGLLFARRSAAADAVKDARNPGRGDPQSALMACPPRRRVTTSAYLSARDGVVGLSGQRRFVPRASTRLTTKLCLPAQKMAASRKQAIGVPSTTIHLLAVR
jgi:hypothetical protein